MADRGNVEPARRHVRSDEEAHRSVAETVKRLHPLALFQIAVDRRGIEPVRPHRLGEDVDLGLAVAKQDGVGAGRTFGSDHRAQQFAFLLGGLVLAGRHKFDQPLLDRLGGGGLARDLDPGRVLQEGLGDPLDLGRHGGGIEEGLAGEGGQAEDPLDIGDEPHVEHAVGLVHHHDLHAGQQKLAALEMVEQPARRGDQHVDAAVDQLVLFGKADPADQQRLGQLGVLGIDVEVFGDLGGKFAGRCQHEAARHPRPCPAAPQKRDHRQREAGGLAGAGLGDAQNVTAFKRMGDRAGLDRGGGLVAGFCNGLQDPGVQFQIGKFGHERPSGCGFGPQR